VRALRAGLPGVRVAGRDPAVRAEHEDVHGCRRALRRLRAGAGRGVDLGERVDPLHVVVEGRAVPEVGRGTTTTDEQEPSDDETGDESLAPTTTACVTETSVDRIRY